MMEEDTKSWFIIDTKSQVTYVSTAKFLFNSGVYAPFVDSDYVQMINYYQFVIYRKFHIFFTLSNLILQLIFHCF
jgi:hypothetical protein